MPLAAELVDLLRGVALASVLVELRERGDIVGVDDGEPEERVSPLRDVCMGRDAGDDRRVGRDGELVDGGRLSGPGGSRQEPDSTDATIVLDPSGEPLPHGLAVVVELDFDDVLDEPLDTLRRAGLFLLWLDPLDVGQEPGDKPLAEPLAGRGVESRDIATGGNVCPEPPARVFRGVRR